MKGEIKYFKELIGIIMCMICYPYLFGQCPDMADLSKNKHCVFVKWSTPPSPLPTSIVRDLGTYNYDSGSGTSSLPAIYQASGGNGSCNGKESPFSGTLNIGNATCEYQDGQLSSLLPIELGDFSASSRKSGVLLTWTTLSEIDNESFEVQRSRDGEEWEVISRIDGQINSSTTQDYSFTDRGAVAGDNYYRLKQIDLDGQHSFSKIVVVYHKGQFGQITLFPNPTTDVLNIYLAEDKGDAIVVGIHNAFGQQLAVKAVDGRSVDVSDLLPGIYFLVLDDNAHNFAQRFVIL